MKKIRNLFMILAAVLISALSASAQDMAEMLVGELARNFNNPAVVAEMTQQGVANFNAEADGKILGLNMTISDPTVDFDTLSEAEKEELTGSFKNLFVSGMGGNGNEVVAMLNQLGIKIRVCIHDSYGHTLSKTLTF